MAYKAPKRKDIGKKIFAWIMIFGMLASFIGMVIVYFFMG